MLIQQPVICLWFQKGDNCVTSVTLGYQTGTLNNQDKGDSWSYTKDQGVTYTLTITLLLVNGDTAVVWNKVYTTKSGEWAKFRWIESRSVSEELWQNRFKLIFHHI